MRKLLKIVLPLLGKVGLIKYTALGILSGLCNFIFINFLNRLIALTIAGNYTTINWVYTIIFASIILLFVCTRRALSLAVIKLSQQLFWSLRKQILSLVLQTNYKQLSSTKVQIQSSMVHDIDVLTHASMNIIDFFTASILATACLVYLSSISFVLFVITLCIICLGITIYHLKSKKNNKRFEHSRSLENNFLTYFNAILNGFKEIYINPTKGKSIYNNHINPLAIKAYTNNTKAFTGFLNNQITGQVLFYVLISSILLFFGIVLHIKVNDTISFVFTLLYLLASVETIMILLPELVRARIAAHNVINLKEVLETTPATSSTAEWFISKHTFHSLVLHNVSFAYEKMKDSFSIGPINLHINKGEVIFIYGGNGSGKTTFVYSLLSLHTPLIGEIKLNDRVVQEHNYVDYRNTFAVVFSDFYLFNEVLGVDSIDIKKWNYYLKLFEIEDKVKLEDGNKLSTIDLSTGQRKRVALIAMLLEEKPILVLDEWAADQDPYFRKKFYTEIIPLLKKSGFTIIAITHDDKYYHCADKLFKMEYGRLTEEDTHAHNPSFTSKSVY